MCAKVAAGRCSGLNIGGKTFNGSAAEINNGARANACKTISPVAGL